MLQPKIRSESWGSLVEIPMIGCWIGWATQRSLGMQRRACEVVVYAAELCQGNLHAIPVWFAAMGDTIYAPKSSHGARA